jgi:hypothetical protein
MKQTTNKQNKNPKKLDDADNLRRRRQRRRRRDVELPDHKEAVEENLMVGHTHNAVEAAFRAGYRRRDWDFVVGYDDTTSLTFLQQSRSEPEAVLNTTQFQLRITEDMIEEID